MSSSNAISSLFALQRARTDSANFYLSGLFVDTTNSNIRRAFLGKVAYSNGEMRRLYFYIPGGSYNSDNSVAVIRRMNLFENELTNQHIISACIVSMDGFRIHFGQFLFTGVTLTAPVVMAPNDGQYNRWMCLGMY